jgi:hypothetical protein
VSFIKSFNTAAHVAEEEPVVSTHDFVRDGSSLGESADLVAAALYGLDLPSVNEVARDIEDGFRQQDAAGGGDPNVLGGLMANGSASHGIRENGAEKRKERERTAYELIVLRVQEMERQLEDRIAFMNELAETLREESVVDHEEAQRKFDVSEKANDAVEGFKRDRRNGHVSKECWDALREANQEIIEASDNPVHTGELSSDPELAEQQVQENNENLVREATDLQAKASEKAELAERLPKEAREIYDKLEEAREISDPKERAEKITEIMNDVSDPRDLTRALAIIDSPEMREKYEVIRAEGRVVVTEENLQINLTVNAPKLADLDF